MLESYDQNGRLKQQNNLNNLSRGQNTPEKNRNRKQRWTIQFYWMKFITLTTRSNKKWDWVESRGVQFC
jgi:hypothetical protein